MTLGAFEDLYVECVDQLNRCRLLCRCYAFGSAIRGEACPSDLDMLIVYPENTDPSEIRLALNCICAAAPIHLMLASEEEARELDLIARQRAVEILARTTAVW